MTLLPLRAVAAIAAAFIATFAASAVTLSAQVAAAPIVIRASTVLDGTGKVLTNVSIVIDGSKIVRIEPAKPGATYDVRTQTVMPGFIDTHTRRTAGRRVGDADEGQRGRPARLPEESRRLHTERPHCRQSREPRTQNHEPRTEPEHEPRSANQEA